MALITSERERIRGKMTGKRFTETCIWIYNISFLKLAGSYTGYLPSYYICLYIYNI